MAAQVKDSLLHASGAQAATAVKYHEWIDGVVRPALGYMSQELGCKTRAKVLDMPQAPDHVQQAAQSAPLPCISTRAMHGHKPCHRQAHKLHGSSLSRRL